VRQFISLMNEGEHDRVLQLCHPDVEAVVKVPSGRVVRGVDELGRFLRDVVAERSMYEVTIAAVRSLDERRFIVESRMRWMDDDRVLRDDPVVWALELDDGLLRRSTPVRTVPEAEALLSAAGGAA
jgi:SnoaL-like domain